MEVRTAKLISMLALGLGSFFAGMLPATFSAAARQRCPLLVSCLLCFGGGVLLSTSLVHMLPEAREKLPENTELLFCVGFFIVYLVDEIVHLFYGNERQSHTPAVAIRYGSNQQNEETGLLRSQDGELQERCCGDAGSPRMCHVSHTAPCNKSASGIIGLLSALFVHSLLEGLAIGLQDSSSEVPFYLLILKHLSFTKFFAL
ncbi:Zinc/iron transporter [Operophtera brumata]|uniref:Zinc/iron transporter n=1 Tax=Operophtera brumata TaxID=104452 RepID=A0A0L7KQV7_OPEBR|nr:Zinc/iron transporter [Operophtera brumata]